MGTDYTQKIPFHAGWYALYTQSRAEKKVVERLQGAGLEAYLPLRKVLKQWSDRKKWVEEPLLRSYVLVRLHNDAEYTRALQIKGASWFVYFEGRPALLQERQVLLLRRLCEGFLPLEVLPEEGIKPGEEREILYGPMAGQSCEVVEVQGKERAMVRLEAMGHVVLIDLPISDLLDARTC